MPAFTTVVGLAALAGSLVHAAPVVARDAAPSNYYTPYLEPYDTYHLRYLALDCQDKHNTTFFDQCCHPLVTGEGETLAGRPAYCTPNATEIASASSFIASTSEYGAPTPTSDAGSSPATATTSSIDDASQYSAAEASSTEPTTQGALASPTTTTTQAPAPTTTSTTKAAPATTSSQSSSNSGTPSGALTGGYATYFYQNGNPGACGNYNSDSTPLVAIDQAWWKNFGEVSPLCGKWVTIQNNNNGKTVNARIQDVCPTCDNGNSLDLSVGAFTAIASESEGMVPITWWFD